jgi:PAS domain S-box-containing protein
VFINRKEYDKAIEKLKNAHKLAEQIKSKDYLYEINRNLSDCFKHKGNYKKALEYFNKYYEIKNEVFNEQSDNKLKNLQVIHQVDTAQKEAEIQRFRNVELKHALSELTSALDVTEIISRTDTNGNIIYINENFCRVSGYAVKELIGNNHRIVKSGHHSGRFYKDLWDTVKKGDVWKGEIMNKSKNGKLYWVDTTIVPLLDANKKLIEFLAITTNITQRKEAEEKLKKQFFELEKTNSELDKFVYSASHDLRAPLTSVLGLIGLTKMDTKDKHILDYLDMMEKSINRLDGFVIDIINYSRNSRLDVQKEKIDFNLLISETFENLKYIEGADKIETKININEKAPFYSDKSRLRVIFNNLISNSIRYHKHNIEHPNVYVTVNVSDENVVIKVMDNGVGIDKKYIDKIFDMFYKVSKNSLGSGLGLYIVKETVNKLNGKISVESELNKGCTSTIEIPTK